MYLDAEFEDIVKITQVATARIEMYSRWKISFILSRRDKIRNRSDGNGKSDFISRNFR